MPSIGYSVLSMETNIQNKYNADYFSGKDSFFYSLTGGYRDLVPYFNRLAGWFGEFLGDGALLDIGCAYGYMLSRFDDGRDLYGCDVSEYALRQAKEKLPGAKLELIDISRDALPYEESSFSGVLCTDVLEHIEKDKQDFAIEQIHRVLKKDGYLCLTLPNRSLIRAMLYFWSDKKEGHIGMRHISQWCQMLQGQGFEIIKRWTYIHGLPPFPRRRVKYLPECSIVAKKI